jgi:hypothetical protein
MQNGNSSLIEYLVGIAIQGIGLASCEELLHDESMSSEQLRKLCLELAAYTSNERGLRRAFMGEYNFAVPATEGLCTGKGAIEDYLFTERHWSIGFLQRHLIQRNRTLHLYSGFYRRMVSNAGQSYADMALSNFVDQPSSASRVVGLVLRPNPLGQVLYRILVPGIEGALKKSCYLEATISSVRVAAACRAYEKDTGELPDALAQLVPAYIDAIPRDPWDGQPMRFSKDKAIVYTVGSDLIDSGGSTEATNPKYKSHKSAWRAYAEDMVFELHPEDTE